MFGRKIVVLERFIPAFRRNVFHPFLLQNYAFIGEKMFRIESNVLKTTFVMLSTVLAGNKYVGGLIT